jgi:hypothetical protein
MVKYLLSLSWKKGSREPGTWIWVLIMAGSSEDRATRLEHSSASGRATRVVAYAAI